MLIRNSIYSRTLVLFICVFLANLAAGRIIYVDDDAPGANDGSSWADACADLTGILSEEARPGYTIRVAQGVYRPAAPDGDRGQSFLLKDGVTLEGGYAGFGEPDPDARDTDVYKTILSGDLNGDDGPNFSNNTENICHVIQCGNTNESTVLDGFTITGGYAYGTRTREENGGGMYNVRGSPTIVNCTFSGNSTEKCGGGMYNEGGSPEIINCTFSGNSANKGGGLYNDISSAAVRNCTFSNNSAKDLGGGMYNDNSDSELLSCLFVGNQSTWGGGLFNTEGDPNLTNCIFSGNRAELGGGMFNVYSRPILTNCTFSRNSADFGGGTFNIDADPDFTNCILWRNKDNGRGTDELAQIYVESGTPTVNYCCVQGWTGQWQGEGNIHSDPLFVDDDGEDDNVGSQDDDLHLLWNSPCINAGDNNAVLLIEYDYDGYSNPRVCKDVNEVVDMGAFEFCESSDLYEIIYVDRDANGANDGTSWVDAFTCLQDALHVAEQYRDVRKVRVAKGIYTPAEAYGSPDETFQLINNIAIQGGYAGWGEPDPNAPDIYLDPNTRNTDLYETILSGDLNGDDANMTDPCDYLTDPNRADNSFHVVTGSGTDASAELDGFVITGGMANGLFGDEYGGGMYIMLGDPTIIRCTFRGNGASGDGGGILCRLSGPSIQNCVISQNFAQNGAGICCLHSWPTIAENVIEDNNAIGNGGGIYCANQSSPSITDNEIKSNQADYHGGGICCTYDSDPNILRNTIEGNIASVDGGGIYCSYSSDANIINNFIFANVAIDDGGGICCIEDSSATIRNNTIVGNRANPQGGGIFSENENFQPTITNCIIWKNGDDLHDYISGRDCNTTYCCIEDSSEGLGNISLAPYFVDPDNGDYHLKSYSHCIDAGDPNSDYSMEPAPNGERANMGAYGNTEEAATKSEDLDGVGIPDDWEYEHFGNLEPRPDDDLDGDGLTNQEEYQAGTDPNVAYDGLKSIVYVSIYNPDDPNADGTLDHPFPTIKQGIDAAQERAEILVTKGTFYERLIIDGKVLFIYGGYDQDFNLRDHHTTLSTEGQGRALLYVNVPDGALSQFIITNCNERDGGGMYFFNSSSTITNSKIIENTARDDGGGISCYFESKPVFKDCLIAGNDAVDNAGGIYCRNAAPTFHNCDIRDNQAEDSAGIYLRNSKPVISYCNIIGNTARDNGGGIVSRQGSEPNISNCTIRFNTADNSGGGIRIWEGSSAIISNCLISGNSPQGFWADSSTVEIDGTVEIISNDCAGKNLVLIGDGTLQIQSAVTIELDNSSIQCNVSGPGTIDVESDSELFIEGDANIDLGGEGMIQCNGLLYVRDSAKISNANISVTRAKFEGDVNISNSVITAEAGAPYGQFFIEDTVEIIGNDIHANGDRYMDLDPSVFDGLVENNRIYVRITEGKNQSRGGLFELRGQDDLVSSACGDDEFLCKVDGTIPDFDLKSWTLEELTLEDGAKVNLTNRFDFQPPYDSGGDEEVLYVRKLVLGEGAVLNTAFNQIYYETLIGDPCEVVKHVPLLGFSLNNIAFDDATEFVTRIKHNNLIDPDLPEYNRYHVERVVDAEPDPNGMMQMCNLLDIDPKSSTYDQVVNARAKGLFAKSNEDEILIQFEYLFGTFEPGLELVIYLTDVPELLEHYDPNRQDHYIEVARLPVPPVDRPGSPGSGRFGVFHKYISRGDLDFVRGTRIELELVGPDGACVLINNWDPQIHCSELYCGDVTGDKGATIEDYLTVIASVGSPVEIHPDGNSTTCLEFGFGVDGRVDTLDVSARAWMLGLEESERPLNLCDVPLTPGMATVSAATTFFESSNTTRLLSLEPPDIQLDALLVTGKRGADNVSDKLLEDNLYVLDANGQYIDKFEPEPNRSNGKLVQDSYGEIYQVNHEKGLLRLSDGDPVIQPAGFPIDIDPRYGLPAQVSIGLGHKQIYSDIYEEFIWTWVGRPILDAAFDADGYVYVVPVVVDPDGNEPYVVAAKLQLLDTADPSYRVVQLYDDPPPSGDNQYLNNLREIEIDRAGNLYVINTDKLNEADILWVYDTETGQVKRCLTLGNRDGDCYLPAPVTMHVSNTKDRMYIASSQNDPDANSDLLYVLSKQDLNIIRPIEINGMGHITDITEDPTTGTLWVVGFTMSEIPDYIDTEDEPFVGPFYEPYLAGIPYEGNGPVEAMPLSAPILYPDNDLALPLSIIWTAAEEKRENFVNFAVFATHWLESSCTSPDWCNGADFTRDGNVIFNDLLMFCDNWLIEKP